MIITLTGSEGFIGKHIDFANERIDLKKDSDILEMEDVGHVVVHLAAVSSIPRSIEDTRETMRTNIYGLAHVIDLCKKQKAKLVFASSSGIVDPKSPYSYSKLWGEKLIKEAGIDYTILRFGNVYGPGDDKSAIYHFLNDAEITIYGNGQIVRNFVYVKDVVNAIYAACHGLISGTVNIGKENMTIEQVAKLFNKPIRYTDGKDYDAFSHAMDSDWPSKMRLEQWLNTL